jgi:hypothetical protein
MIFQDRKYLLTEMMANEFIRCAKKLGATITDFSDDSLSMIFKDEKLSIIVKSDKKDKEIKTGLF